MIYYVYIFFRLNGIPCYVGKGKGERWKEHIRNSNNPYLRGILRQANGNLPVVIVREHLTESEAFELEKMFITTIGRRDLGTGPLCNLTNGGDGVVGYSNELRARIAASQRGRKHSAEHRAKNSAARLGQKRSEKTRVAMRAAWQRRDHSVQQTTEWIDRLRAVNLGKKLSPEHRAKLSAIRQGKRKTAQHCMKISLSLRRHYGSLLNA